MIVSQKHFEQGNDVRSQTLGTQQRMPVTVCQIHGNKERKDSQEHGNKERTVGQKHGNKDRKASWSETWKHRKKKQLVRNIEDKEINNSQSGTSRSKWQSVRNINSFTLTSR